MAEKGGSFVPVHQWRLGLLIGLVVVGMVVVWSIDGFSINNIIKSSWQFKQDYNTLSLNSLPDFNHSLANLTSNSTLNTTHSLASNSTSKTTHSLGSNSTLNTTHSLASNSTSKTTHSLGSHSTLNTTHSLASNSTSETTHSLGSNSTLNTTHSLASNPSLDTTHSLGSNQTLNTTHLPLLNKSVTNSTPIKFNDWISAELEKDFTANLLTRWLAPGGEPCKDSETVDIKIPGLDGFKDRLVVELSAGEIHDFVFQAVDEAANARCLGGDYFEFDLSGDSWKSRPPVQDLGNGSYSFSLQVHPDFAGEYDLTVILLFRHFKGLKYSPARFAYDRQLRHIRIRFFKTKAQLPKLHVCRKSDFNRDVWSGRWTRHAKNDDCQISDDGRFRCLPSDFPCQDPWCNGSLATLESNGWVYSTHCSFRLFSADSAWDCLKNRWIFFWGDSNHVDTIRNMLNFVLDLPMIESVPRRFDMNFSNPKDHTQTVRITSIFNGHWNETGNYLGLDSLKNEGFRNLLKKYFSENTVPDTIVMNSGLHDGVHWMNVRSFSHGADYAAWFWKDLLESVRQRGLIVPQIIFRSTVASGGYARSLAFNPNKMEVFNKVFLEKLRQAGLVSSVIDNFDMTFSWHFDNRCNDGVHYGRAPLKMKWRDGEIGHQYFVDLMLCHVLLNVLCA